MFPHVPVRPKTLEAYRRAAGDSAVEMCLEAARDLKGMRVLHINSTAFGGGVAEILYTQVPLMRDVGLDAQWTLFPGNDEFYSITKSLHNGLQGMPVTITNEMRQNYLLHTQTTALDFIDEFDFVFVHDPQPAALLSTLRELNRDPKGKWVWRCHIDLTAAVGEVWDFLAPYVGGHDGAIFTHDDFAKPLPIPVFVVPPSIDPRAPKNASIHNSTRVEVLERYEIDPGRPIICQVSRFDPWKDPLGVIDAYRIVKQEIPDLQLVMVASMAHDDPEGMHFLELTDERRAEDPDIFLLSNLQGVGDVEVNAFQRSAAVVIQKSLREGFGLTVSEAMWKSRPVVGGNTGGIRLQIDENVNGFLVSSVEEAAQRLLFLLNHPRRARRMGEAGRAKVRQRFLSTRHLFDYLRLMGDLTNAV